MGAPLGNSRKYRTHTAQKLDESPFTVRLTIGAYSSFYDALLKAVDEAFSSLGESAKTSIYYHLENSAGIKRQEIPFRINDFQNALERIFGMGARHLEILFVKNLHKELKIKCKWDIPRGVPYLTFQEYIRLVKAAYEDSNAELNEQELEDEAL